MSRVLISACGTGTLLGSIESSIKCGAAPESGSRLEAVTGSLQEGPSRGRKVGDAHGLVTGTLQGERERSFTVRYAAGTGFQLRPEISNMVDSEQRGE